MMGFFYAQKTANRIFIGLHINIFHGRNSLT